MKRVAAGLVLTCVVSWVALGRESDNASLADANLAWDRGDYVTALSAYLTLLGSGEAAAVLAPIALQTGELYTTTELTPDGAAPRFSPDGRHITYETGTGAMRFVRLVEAARPAAIKATLPGFGASFSPDGSRIAYLKLTPTRELTDAHTAMEQAPASERTQRLTAINDMTADASRITVYDVERAREIEFATGELRKSAPTITADGTIVFAGSAGSGPTQIYSVSDSRPSVALTDGPDDKTLQEVNSTGTAAIVGVRPPVGGRAAGASGLQTFGVLSFPGGLWTSIAGSAPSFSSDGRSFAYVTRTGEESQLMLAWTANPGSPAAIRKGPERMDAPALSGDGRRVAFQLMLRDDWELYVIDAQGTGERRVTREIQHDLQPRFLAPDRLLAVVGEARHRRSYLYDLTTGDRTRLFHNNTVRTIAPEYTWASSRDGTRVLISAERDGNTVSAERGVYLVDLSRRVTLDALRARLAASIAAEEALIANGRRMYAPIEASVRRVADSASVARVFGYEKALYDFDSKHISQPGNKLAGTYLFETYKSFGYEPQYQWFETRGALEGRTANVTATLRGTVNPELVYVVSSHYDSVAGGPGADDDSSGTAALLEAARILARHPQPATIVFASFTGEESGLLGSREFVRRAVAANVRVVGALNNDMIGWANDHRLDNTIRYSNPGIRDVQHAAAMQFTRLITYDALYYKGTDAAAYYEAYGDIVGGIGSYPVLGNPHYHQPHDTLETVNHQLVTEVARTTAATLMLLASSPSRITGLTIDRYENGVATLSWKPAPEAGVTGYIVAYGPAAEPESQQMTVQKPSASIRIAAGSAVAVRAVNAKGLTGWDWARVTVR